MLPTNVKKLLYGRNFAIKSKNMEKRIFRVIENPGVLIALLKGIPPNQYFYCVTARELLNGSAKTVIDIGANRGDFVRACRFVFPKSKIYAFEPQKEFYNVLKNIPRVKVFNFGLWDKTDEKTFYINKTNSGASSFLQPTKKYKKYIGDEKNISKSILKLKRFDKLNIKIERPCFVKIDVEGAEEKVISGMGDMLYDVDILQLEIFFMDLHKGQAKLSKLLPLLEKYGFSGFIQKELAYNQDSLKPRGCDLIFYKK